MARLIETTDFWGRQSAVLHGVKKGRLPKPERVEHPDRRRSAPPKAMAEPTKDPNRIAKFFGLSPKGGEE